MPNMDQLTNQQTAKRAIQFNNDSDEDDSKKQKQLGFTETLKRKPKLTNNLPLNINRCSNIFINGNKYFYPSEFPKLTKIKIASVLKGGKISRKYKTAIKRKSKRKN